MIKADSPISHCHQAELAAPGHALPATRCRGHWFSWVIPALAQLAHGIKTVTPLPRLHRAGCPLGQPGTFPKSLRGMRCWMQPGDLCSRHRSWLIRSGTKHKSRGPGGSHLYNSAGQHPLRCGRRRFPSAHLQGGMWVGS